MSLFRCWYFLGVIVQVLGPILARCWFGHSNETTRFHQSDLRVSGRLAALGASAAGADAGDWNARIELSGRMRAARVPTTIIGNRSHSSLWFRYRARHSWLVRSSSITAEMIQSARSVGCMIGSPKRSGAKTYLWTSTTSQLGSTSWNICLARSLRATFS
jgi:hypothetical protein